MGGMARQTGPLKITGTIEDLCFYQMEGAYFARRKSSLTSKRFWKEKAFAGSRRSCGLLGAASPLASRLYHTLPKAKKGRAVFQQLTGAIKRLLQQGWTAEAIAAWFAQTYLPAPSRKKRPAAPVIKALPAPCLHKLPSVERTHRNRCQNTRRRDGKQPPGVLPRGQPQG